MIKQKLIFLIFFCLPYAMVSQSLDLKVIGGSPINAPNTFDLYDGKVKINSNTSTIEIAGSQPVSGLLRFGISHDKRFVGVAKNEGKNSVILLFNSSGDSLLRFDSISLGEGDPSLALFPFDNGNILIRNNIANLTVYDPNGEIINSVSASSDSEMGETITEVVVDQYGNTVLVYTPKIRNGNSLGSRAHLLQKNNQTKSIYSSSNRTISHAAISDDGTVMVLITKQEGSDDRAILYDRFGNRLNSIESSEDLIGATFADDSNFVILYSSRRVLVYKVLSGERLGSTSFRSTVLSASYFPNDNNILGVTGNYVESTGLVNNIEFHVINLAEREVVRKEFPTRLGTSEKIPVRFERLGVNKYRFKGASSVIEITPSF